MFEIFAYLMFSANESDFYHPWYTIMTRLSEIQKNIMIDGIILFW